MWGGANDGVENTQSNGTNRSISSTVPLTNSDGLYGGPGYGGGQGGNSWSGFGTPTGSGGEGGQSYAINTTTHVVDTPGNGGAGGFGANGGNGYVDISFYS